MNRDPNSAEGQQELRGQTDAEIGAMVRAAYQRHSDFVDLDRIESVEVAGGCRRGSLLLSVTHRSRLKAGVRG